MTTTYQNWSSLAWMTTTTYNNWSSLAWMTTTDYLRYVYGKKLVQSGLDDYYTEQDGVFNVISMGRN